MRLYRAPPARLARIGIAGALLGLVIGFVVCLLAQGLLVAAGHALTLPFAVAICCWWAAVGAFAATTEI